jgi:hypothetical protein
VNTVKRVAVVVASLIVTAVALSLVAQEEVMTSIWGHTAEGVAVPTMHSTTTFTFGVVK